MPDNPDIEYIQVEEATPFAKSGIWGLQKQYYEKLGVNAWREGHVPHYITSNPSIAQTYADLVFGIFRDIYRQGKTGDGKLFLLELGGGMGRFTFHFLKCLESLCEDAAFDIPDYCFVLSDLVKKNFDFWHTHSKLKPFVDAGKLDFALVDITDPQELTLSVSGVKLNKASVQQPIIVIGNYIFDSIPPDLFYIKQGKVQRAEVSLFFPKEAEKYESITRKIDDARIKYHYTDIEGLPYVDEELNELLTMYREGLEESHVFIPTMAISFLEKVRGFSLGGLILLSADKGYHQLQQMEGLGYPDPTKHGSFSVLFNYHAIKTLYTKLGGRAYFSDNDPYSINVCCITALAEPEEYRELAKAFQRHVDVFVPDEYFSIKRHTQKHIETMEVRDWLAYIRFSRYDAWFLTQSLPHLMDLSPKVTNAEKGEICKIFRHVWDMYYPIGEVTDLAFNIGLMLYQIGCFQQSVWYFEESLKIYGPGAITYYNIAVSYYQMDTYELAHFYLGKALELDPDHEGSLKLKPALEKYITVSDKA